MAPQLLQNKGQSQSRASTMYSLWHLQPLLPDHALSCSTSRPPGRKAPFPPSSSQKPVSFCSPFNLTHHVPHWDQSTTPLHEAVPVTDGWACMSYNEILLPSLMSLEFFRAKHLLYLGSSIWPTPVPQLPSLGPHDGAATTP